MELLRPGGMVLECVVNVSEGRDLARLGRWADRLGRDVLDVHTDPWHHRSVFTLVGEAAPRRLSEFAVAELDLAAHDGVHPRIGVVDVVPFVPLAGSTMPEALEARDSFARWAWEQLGVPCFLYGPQRSLPDVRRSAFTNLAPDVGGPRPHRTAGAMAVGAREVLVAYNLWLAVPDLALARHIAAQLRGPGLRTLGLAVGDRVQVSCNLIDPERVGPDRVFDAVASQATVERAELVGLMPDSVLRSIDPQRWVQLGISEDRTIESRLARRALEP